MDTKKTFNFFEKNRRRLSAVFLVISLALVLVTRHSWPSGSAVSTAFIAVGIVLVFAGVLGRLWCTLYIGGRKNADLVMDGPYSLCRNPLYFFSFTAGLGISFEFQNVALIALYAVFFSVYYPFVISSEERRLHMLFGDKFLEYKSGTPAFLINPLRFHAGELPQVSYRLLWKNFLDGSLFIAFIPVAFLVERLQQSGVLHVIWRVP